MERIVVDADTDFLGVIDVQPCFMPGGALAVPNGDAVLPPINQLLSKCFAHGFATQDWHPPGHLSFASMHPEHAVFDTVEMPYGMQTLWPDHAVQGTAEAALHPDLDQTRIELIVRKGFRRSIDSYSAFFENDRRLATGLDGYLRARGVRRVFLAGLATDFCVAFSAEDAARRGFDVFVVEDACRGIAIPLAGGGNTLDAAWQRLQEAGVRRVTTGQLCAA